MAVGFDGLVQKDGFSAAKIRLFWGKSREKYLYEGTKKARRPMLTALQNLFRSGIR